MKLPKIDVPIYDVNLPSTGRSVKIRPFTVKEEKLLLMAVESKDNEKIIKTTKQVINNCIVQAHGLDIEKLPFFDIDYLFIALRAKSIGETIEMNYTCNNQTEQGSCGGMFQADIDISKCVINKGKDIDSNIKLSEKITVKMRYPTYEIMKAIMGNETIIEKKIRIMCHCIERVVSDGTVYSAKDFSKTEVQAFVEGLTQEQYKKLEEFVDNFPTFFIESAGKCPKCGFEHKIKYTDFTRFFQ